MRTQTLPGSVANPGWLLLGEEGTDMWNALDLVQQLGALPESPAN